MNRQKIQVRCPMLPATTTGSAPPSLPAVVVGIAMAPKPTLMALPTTATTAALILGTPNVTSMAQVMATGAPKPAKPSSRPQKHQATMRAWARWSPRPIVLKTAFRSELRPDFSVRLYSHTAAMMM